MTRRRLTLGVSVVILVVLLVVGSLLRVPYVILEPGPVTDTLGNIPTDLLAQGQSDGPVISVTGARTQAPSGHLYLTTVSVDPGDCNARPTLWEAFRAWVDHKRTVVPQQAECPPGQSAQQVQQSNAQQMSQSQTDATVAALRELGRQPTGKSLVVESIENGTSASKSLQLGDVLTSVDGQQTTTVAALQHAVRSRPVGTTLTLGVRRNGTSQVEHVTTIKGPKGVPLIGISTELVPQFGNVSVKVGIDPDVVGGPSAGTALALGIVDKLTPGGLTGGRTIAGTGTITPSGTIGPIGGIQQKVYAAVAHHATVFFAPASECPDAKAVAPSSLILIRSTTLRSVVTALQDIKAGRSDFPHC
jgi:PDZ domain-containing protein